MRREIDYRELGCLGDALANEASRSALRLLDHIIANLFSDNFNTSELKELVSFKETDFEYLCDQGILNEDDGSYFVNQCHPFVAGQSIFSSDVYPD
jgi:hypothetical protein